MTNNEQTRYQKGFLEKIGHRTQRNKGICHPGILTEIKVRNKRFKKTTSRERPKSALYLRLKIVKGGGEPFGNLKKFPKKDLWTVSQCRKMERKPLGFFDIHCVGKCRNKWRGGPLVQSKKSQYRKKSGALGGSLVCFRGSERLFCFFFSFWTRFWGSSCWGSKLLRFDDVEQKSGPYASKRKKLPTVRVGHIF